MALDLPVFFKRLGSAIVFAIVMMTGLLWVDIAFVILMALIHVLCMREFFRLLQKIDTDMHLPGWLPCITQATGLVGILLLGLEKKDAWEYYFVFLTCYPAIVLLVTILSKKTALKAGLQSFSGLLYITVPLLSLIFLRYTDYSLPIAIILMIWMNDTMAYLVGSFIGKNPFSPISPKKTWEGTTGGAILTVAGAAIWGYFAHNPNIKMIDWVVISFIVAIAGTAGDLFESKLKRLANVKDSGTMMPGHGGALDRFDSLLVAVPFVLAYVLLFVKISE